MAQTKTITLLTRGGTQEVEAEIFGYWAVYRTTDSTSAYKWSVGHVGTGLLAAMFAERAAARAVAGWLRDNATEPEWGETNPDILSEWMKGANLSHITAHINQWRGARAGNSYTEWRASQATAIP